ncbi:MAG: methytransferase partner Trm112 [Thermoplasmatota archaeon]
MKKNMMDILCCPTCKGELALKVKEEKDNEIINGSLTCSSCKVSYDIIDGIPNLLPKK